MLQDVWCTRTDPAEFNLAGGLCSRCWRGSSPGLNFWGLVGCACTEFLYIRVYIESILAAVSGGGHVQQVDGWRLMVDDWPLTIDARRLHADASHSCLLSGAVAFLHVCSLGTCAGKAFAAYRNLRRNIERKLPSSLIGRAAAKPSAPRPLYRSGQSSGNPFSSSGAWTGGPNQPSRQINST